MAQRISAGNSVPYAQEALPFSALKRGQGAMNQVNMGRKNMDDGGSFSKPYANAQEQRNMELGRQNAGQNGITSQYQAVANATGQARKSIAESSAAESRDKQYMNSKLANVLEATSTQGAGIKKLNGLMEGPHRAAFENDIAVSNAMYRKGEAPELGQLTQEANRYVG